MVTPILPGDSLLFAAGAFAATGALNVWLLFVLLFIAAALGDSVNSWIANRIGPRAFQEEVHFLKRECLERTQRFYEKHGGMTIFLARFIPMIRTFAPFVAGAGTLDYRRFALWNVMGAFVLTSVFLFAGCFFGNTPIVRDNLGLVVIAIVLISGMPVGYELLLHRLRPAAKPAPEQPLPEDSA